MRFFKGLNYFTMLFVGVMVVVAQQEISVVAAQQGPVDIYNASGVQCVAAYSTVRKLSSTYNGPLYQVRRTSDNATTDVYPLSGGTVANAATQDNFLGSGAGTISLMYDQSGRGNHLPRGRKGCYSGTAGQDDNECNAKGRSLYVGGHKAYALYMAAVQGYRSGGVGYPTRSSPGNGMPTGTAAQGCYEVVDGQRYGTSCCWDFGNVSTNNCYGPTGQMNTVFFGTGYWGRGAGNGPWFMGDFEAGVWSGGPGNYTTWSANPSINYPYAFGLVKTNTGPNYCIRVGNATSGSLTNVYDGSFTTTWKMEGGIAIGVGGDNSNSSYGTFFEGVITNGRPSNTADDNVLANIHAAGYGVTAVFHSNKEMSAPTPLFKVRYNPSKANALISYTLQDARHVSMSIVDEQGRQIAVIVNGVMTAGPHKAVWDAKRVPAGVYVCRVAIEGREGMTEKIIVHK